MSYPQMQFLVDVLPDLRSSDPTINRSARNREPFYACSNAVQLLGRNCKKFEDMKLEIDKAE